MPSRDPTVRNVWAVAGPELLWGFGSALTIEGPMPAAFAQSLGAGKGFLGLWFLVGSTALALAMLLTGWYVPSLAKKRGLVAWGHFVVGALYLPVGLLARHAGPPGSDAAQVGALVGFGLFMLGLGFLLPAWVALIGELFPEGRRGRVLAFVFVVNRAGGILGGLAAERLLRLAWAPGDVWTLLWGLAAAASALGALPLLGVVEPDVARHPRAPLRSHVSGMLRTLSELPALRRFILLDLLTVAGWVTVGFYGDAALGRGIDPHWSGIWTAAAAGAQLLGAALVTWRGVAPLTGLAVGAAAAALASLLAGWGGGPLLFVAVAALAGVFVVSRQTCQGPEVMALTPGREPTLPLSMAMSATSLLQGVLPLAAGLLLPLAGYGPVLVVVAGLTGTAALALPRLSRRPVAPTPGGRGGAAEPAGRGQRPK